MGNSEQKNADIDQYMQNRQYNPQVQQLYQNQQLGTHNSPEDQYDGFIQYGGGVQSASLSRSMPMPKVSEVKTMAIKNEMFVIKSSFKMVKEQATVYNLQFQYTTEVPAVISIYSTAQETVNESNLTQNIDMLYYNQQASYQFNVMSGSNQEFKAFYIDLRHTPVQDLIRYDTNANYFPLIVSMVLYFSHILEVTLIRRRNEEAILVLLPLPVRKKNNCNQGNLPQIENRSKRILSNQKQNGQAHVINEVFGINESCLAGNSGTSEKECIVCLTEIINTMILPCKHMVLCHICCEDLRIRQQKCPICRTRNQYFYLFNKAINGFVKVSKSDQQAQQPQSQQPQYQQPQYQQQQYQQPQQPNEGNFPQTQIYNTGVPTQQQQPPPAQNTKPQYFQGQGHQLG